MSSFTNIPTPNSRLLYTQESIANLERWQSALARVENTIWGERDMEEANSAVYLYFFAPAQDWVREDRYWVGREIVGIPRDMGNSMALYDLDRGYCERSTLGPFPEAWEVLPERETDLRRDYTLERGRAPALTWRVMLDAEEPQEIFLELFAEK